MINGNLFSWSYNVGTTVNLPIAFSCQSPIQYKTVGKNTDNFKYMDIRSHRTGKVEFFYRDRFETIKSNNGNLLLVLHYLDGKHRINIKPTQPISLKLVYDRNCEFLKLHGMEFIKNYRFQLNYEMTCAYMADYLDRSEIGSISDEMALCDQMEALIRTM